MGGRERQKESVRVRQSEAGGKQRRAEKREGKREVWGGVEFH